LPPVKSQDNKEGRVGSSGKRKTTFAKLARESKLRERRLEKQAKREARKRRASEDQPPQVADDPSVDERPYDAGPN
jgi:hypothetical protein